MQVEDGIKIVALADSDDPIQQPETSHLQLERAVIVLEMQIVERDPNVVHTERGEILSIIVREERRHKTIEKEFIAFTPESVQQRFSMGGFCSRKAGEEVLHI